MRRVAEAVGITPMAIYRHFPDRAALLNALADEGFDQLATKLQRLRRTGTIESQLGRVAAVFVDHALSEPRQYELMFIKRRVGARRYPADFEAGESPTSNPAAELLAEGMRRGELKRGPVWEIVFEMGALSHGLIMLYLGGRMGMPPVDFRAFYRRSFKRHLRGIRK